MNSCKLIKLDDDCTGFVCGTKPDHECNSNGETYYGFSDGFEGTLFEKAKIEKLNLNMCDEDKLYFLSQKDIHVLMCSVSCSICGRPAIMDRVR